MAAVTICGNKYYVKFCCAQNTIYLAILMKLIITNFWRIYVSTQYSISQLNGDIMLLKKAKQKIINTLSNMQASFISTLAQKKFRKFFKSFEDFW